MAFSPGAAYDNFRADATAQIFGGVTPDQMTRVLKRAFDPNGDGNMDASEGNSIAAYIKDKISKTDNADEKRVLEHIKDIPDAQLAERIESLGITVEPGAIASLKNSLSGNLQPALTDIAAQTAVKQAFGAAGISREEALKQYKTGLDADGDGTVTKKEAQDFVNSQHAKLGSLTAGQLSALPAELKDLVVKSGEAAKQQATNDPTGALAAAAINKETGLNIDAESAAILRNGTIADATRISQLRALARKKKKSKQRKLKEKVRLVKRRIF